MPAESPAQQHVMGAALSVKRGEKKLSEIEPLAFRAMVAKALHSMTERQLHDFAATKHSEMGGKPQRRTRVRRVRSS